MVLKRRPPKSPPAPAPPNSPPLTLAEAKLAAIAGAGVKESRKPAKPQMVVLQDCGWLSSMKNLRLINTFCWFLAGTDQNRCESAMTSHHGQNGVCTDIDKCTFQRCVWVPQIDPGIPGGCEGGVSFSCDAPAVNASA